MKRLIGCMAALCLVALTVGCGGATTNTRAYVSNSTGTGFTVFTVNTSQGGALNTATIGPQGTDSTKVIQFTPNGLFAFYLDGSGTKLYGFHRASDGTLQPQALNSPYPIAGGAASSLAISPNSEFIYVAIPASNELAVYRISDENTGQLIQQGGINQVVNFPITQLAMSPSGSVLYGLSPAKAQVVPIALNTSTGLPIGTPSGVNVGPTPPDNGMILSADGKYMYVLDSQLTQLITDKNGIQGNSPTFFGFVTCLGQQPAVCTTNPTSLISMGGPFHEDADLTQTPPLFPQGPVAGSTSHDSQYLFIANQTTHNISVFDIHSQPGGQPNEFNGGTVTNVGGTLVSTNSPFDCGTGCSTPAFIAVSTVNNAMYVLNESATPSIFQFGWAPGTGQLFALNPPSVSLPSTNPTWITIR